MSSWPERPYPVRYVVASVPRDAGLARLWHRRSLLRRDRFRATYFSPTLKPNLYQGGSWLGYDDMRLGWTAGAGVEWMFNPKWSVKAEYLYYNLGTANTANVGPLFYTSTSDPLPAARSWLTRARSTGMSSHGRELSLNSVPSEPISLNINRSAGVFSSGNAPAFCVCLGKSRCCSGYFITLLPQSWPDCSSGRCAQPAWSIERGATGL